MKNPFTVATPVAKQLKILLYGPSGSGKTLAALSFPDAALIDAEGGCDLYAGRPGIAPFSILRAKTMSAAEQAITFIREDNGKTFRTLIVDPISVLYDVQKEAYAKNAKGGELGFKEWGQINNRMKAFYNSLTQLPVHVVLIAREAIEYEGSGSNLKKIGTKPDADKSLIYMCDFVVRLNPDHSGEIIKSRGVELGTNGRLAKVQWSEFEKASLAYVEGDKVTGETEEEAVELEAARIRDEETRKALWSRSNGTQSTVRSILAEAGLSKEDVIKALWPDKGWTAFDDVAAALSWQEVEPLLRGLIKHDDEPPADLKPTQSAFAMTAATRRKLPADNP